MISRSQHGYNTFHNRCVRIQIGDLHVKRLQPYQRVFHWSHKRRSKNKHISRMSCSSKGAMRKLILLAWGRTTRERSIKYLFFFYLSGVLVQWIIPLNLDFPFKGNNTMPPETITLNEIKLTDTEIYIPIRTEALREISIFYILLQKSFKRNFRWSSDHLVPFPFMVL